MSEPDDEAKCPECGMRTQCAGCHLMEVNGVRPHMSTELDPTTPATGR